MPARELTAIVIPRGRTAAEKRLSAIAALHQPVPESILRDYTCGECRGHWPCATARLLGAWPNENPDAEEAP